MLALVSSIAVMTGASYDDDDKYLDAFTARIEVLARTHAELSRKKWLGGDLKSVLTNELTPFVALPSDKISLQGPSAYINGRALQSLAMVFHELVTNAIKYGALSEKGKRLVVTWSLSSSELSIQWVEEIEPHSECTGENPEPLHTGFGSTVIESTIQLQLRGKLERTLTAQGIRYSIRIPTDQISYKEPLR
ncbi:MAG: sensor histidine kinase [Marivivens sp.]|nr:sensor histidine kinase [Marivivens sp.]